MKPNTFFVTFMTNVYFNDIVSHAMTQQQKIGINKDGLPAFYVDMAQEAAKTYLKHLDKFLIEMCDSYNKASGDALTVSDFEMELAHSIVSKAYHGTLSRKEMRLVVTKLLQYATREAHSYVAEIADKIIATHTSRKANRNTILLGQIKTFQVMLTTCIDSLRKTINAELNDSPGASVTTVSKDHFETLKREFSKVLLENTMLKQDRKRLMTRLAQQRAAPVAESSKTAEERFNQVLAQAATQAAPETSAVDHWPATSPGLEPDEVDNFEFESYQDYDNMANELRGM